MNRTLKNKFTEAGNNVSYIFTPGEDFTWIAGQYMRFELETIKGKEEHWFTIASAPYEKDIQITTMLSSSSYKKKLDSLKPGDSIIADGLGGDFVWQDTGRKRVYIAGGLGITAYHSILKDRVHRGDPIPGVLLYGTRDDNITFKAEIDKWDAEHPEFRAVYLVGERLNSKLIKVRIPDIKDTFIYIAGPEPMVEDIGAKLIKDLGLPETSLKQDWYPGYTQTRY